SATLIGVAKLSAETKVTSESAGAIKHSITPELVGIMEMKPNVNPYREGILFVGKIIFRVCSCRSSCLAATFAASVFQLEHPAISQPLPFLQTSPPSAANDPSGARAI